MLNKAQNIIVLGAYNFDSVFITDLGSYTKWCLSSVQLDGFWKTAGAKL